MKVADITFNLDLICGRGKNVGESSRAKNFHPVSPLSVVSKIFEKFVNNKLWYRSSRPTAGLPTVLSDRIAWAFNRSWATHALAPDRSKALGRVWQDILISKSKCYGISGQVFGLIFSFRSKAKKTFFLATGWKKNSLPGGQK